MTDTTTTPGPTTPTPTQPNFLQRLGGVFGQNVGGAGGAYTGGSPYSGINLITGLLGLSPQGAGSKGKKAPQNIKDNGLPSLKDVPHATGGFYQQSDPAGRAQMLAAMIARAKQPTGMFPTQPAAPAAPTNPTQMGG